MINLHYNLPHSSPTKHAFSNFLLVFMTEIYECQAGHYAKQRIYSICMSLSEWLIWFDIHLKACAKMKDVFYVFQCV